MSVEKEGLRPLPEALLPGQKGSAPLTLY